MIKMNKVTNSPYKSGDVVTYKGKEYTLDSILVRVNDIKELDKQILVTVVDGKMQTYSINFWKSEIDDPNMFFDGSQYKLAEISTNDIVEFIGFPYMYGDKLQFNSIGGYRLSDKPMEFSSAVDTDKLLQNIVEMIKTIQDAGLRSSCSIALNNIGTSFLRTPAAHSHHHNYIGGLIHHTYEVMKFADSISSSIQCNRDVIITASLFHDLMKVKEYTLLGDYLPFGNKIGHVTGSAYYFMSIADSANVSSEIKDEVVHCILAHHGRKEWGSPVEPNSVEAVIVHQADMLSSRINPFMLSNSEGKLKDYYLK